VWLGTGVARTGVAVDALVSTKRVGVTFEPAVFPHFTVNDQLRFLGIIGTFVMVNRLSTCPLEEFVAGGKWRIPFYAKVHHHLRTPQPEDTCSPAYKLS